MLSTESYLKLTDLFFYRKVPAGLGKHGTIRKYAMPIGWNELVIKKVEKKQTRYGKDMIELTIYLPPSDTVYCQELKEKLSFAPMICRHVIANNAREDIVNKWFKTHSHITPHEAEIMLGWKKKRFNGLVRHHQEVLERDGAVLRNKEGWRVTYWKQEIIRVLPVGSVPDVNYFDLVQFAKNDQVIKPVEEYPF